MYVIITGVRCIHVNPNALGVAHLGDFVQAVERTATGGAQRSHHEERDQAVGAVLDDGIAQRVAAEFVLAVCVQGTEQHATKQASALHGRVGQRGRVRDQLGNDVHVHQRWVRLFHYLQYPCLGAQQRHQSGFASSALNSSS